MKTLEIRWPTVALVVAVVAGVVAIFAFAGPDERGQLLGILAMLGTAGAAMMRAAFGAQAPTPKRINSHDYDFRRCPECGREIAVEGHAEGCSKQDDDDPGEGGEVLADGPPTVPQRRSDMHKTMLAVPVALALRVGVALSVMLLSACSPSALQTHATIASITGHVFDAACAEVETARSREQHAIADGPLDREAAVAAVDAVRAHWAPALASCELAADTHDAWVTALALAAAGAPFTLADGIALAERALDVWRSLTATLATAGVEMPPLPAELVALTGGAL